MHVYMSASLSLLEILQPTEYLGRPGSALRSLKICAIEFVLFYLFLFFSVGRDACLYVEDIDRRRRRICTFFLKMQVLIWFFFGHVAFFRSKFGNDKPLKTCMSRKIERKKRSGAAAQN